MLARSQPTLSFATAAVAFASGALLTWAAAEAVAHMRMRSRRAPISDDVVMRNVRDRVGQIVSHPDAVQVSVENGVVRLAGDVPAEERDQLLTQLLWLPGVVRLRNALGTS